jgi:hypothetical protein
MDGGGAMFFADKNFKNEPSVAKPAREKGPVVPRAV